MLCKKCSTALRIKNSYYAISGGDSPDTETKLVSVTELACPNKKCENFGKNSINAPKEIHNLRSGI